MVTAEKTLSDKLIEQGEKNKSIEIAKEMLKDNVDIKIISKYTGLKPEELKELE